MWPQKNSKTIFFFKTLFYEAKEEFKLEIFIFNFWVRILQKSHTRQIITPLNPSYSEMVERGQFAP
jgi:hypothetical protein